MAPQMHTITVTIDGVDRSSLLLRDSLFVRSSIGNGTDVAEFQLRDPAGSYAPADWDEVIIAVDGARIFGGYIVQRDADSIGAGSHKRAVWQVSCKDWSVLLDRVLVNQHYRGNEDNDIVWSLFDGYLNGEGFDASSHVANLSPDIDIAVEEITLREALNQLAARVGANWHIAPNKAVYWYSPSAPAAAAFNISQTPNGSTTFAPLEGTLKRSIDASQIINRVRVIGSENASTALQTDMWTANGTDNKFGPLTKKPHSLWLVQYTVHVGGNDVNVSAYASQIGIEPNDKLLIDGGEETVLFNLENRIVTITDVGGALPKAGTPVYVKYYYATPIEVIRNDTASQTQFGHVFETSVADDNLTSVAAAQAYGDQVLAQYAFGRESIRFDVTRYGLLPGRGITVTSSTMGLSGSWLIQEVQFTAVAVGQDQFMVVCSVQAGAFVQTLIETLAGGYSAGAGRLTAKASGKLSNIAQNLGDIVAGRATFTDGGTARFNWGTPNGATGVVIGLEDINNTIYGANYIYEGGTIRAKLGRLTGLPDVAGVTPTGWGLYTSNGFFTGKVVASEVVGGTLSAATFNGGNINNGTIAAALIQGGTVTAPYISGGTISGIALTGQTIEGAQITGGTITSVLLDSSFIQNGTISSMAGSIGGFTIDDNLLWSNGGTIATGSVVNSSNPGAYLTGSGLFGFGTLGMTFGLWSDPAKAPWFSSGTINNVVYEVYESGIIRTGPNVFADGGIQIDNSGIFGVNPITGAASLLLESGDALFQENGNGLELYGIRFALDSVTGRLWAEDAHISGAIYANEGRFTGTVSASQISGGTISGAVILGQLISGSDLVGGTINGIPLINAAILNGSLDANLILGGTMTAAQIVGGTITGGVFSGGNVSQGTISAAQITGGTVSGAVFSGGTVSQGTISAAQISGGTVTGGRISGGTVSGALVSAGTVSGAIMSGGTVTGATVNAASGTIAIDSGGIKFSSLTDSWPNPANILWQNAGTTYAYQTTVITGGIVWQIDSVGWNNSNDGNQHTQTVYGAGGNETVVFQTATGWRWAITNSDKLAIDNANQTASTHVRPVTSGTLALGDATHAWRYLYIFDGTDEWRISINTGGTLVATKV